MMFRNKIINGDMRIDQRNAGASSLAANATYYLDRWVFFASQNNKFNIGQNLGSATPPTGFTNYLGLNVASAVSVASGDYFSVAQKIEGFNVADLGWGTTNAKTVTLSFQVYSSLTGTFGAVFRNSSNARAYPFTYTISSANTWTSISVTVVGDATGTWNTNSSSSIEIWWNLGAGSTFSTTAGAWAAGNFTAPTGATSVVGTSGATFYITGVQLEEGTVATPFEHRPYGLEKSLCQRYFMKVDGRAIAYRRHDNLCSCFMTLPQCMRLKQPALENITKGLLTNMQNQPYGTINDNTIAAGGESEMIDRGFLYIEFYSDNTGHTFIPSWEGFNFDVNAEL
jgi:hypothetical protein